MRELLPVIVILILTAAMLIQTGFAKEYEQRAEEALELSWRWQEAYTELQQDYSQAVERIEYLEYELRSGE